MDGRGPQPPAEDDEQAYFAALETLLGRLRGKAILLAPADWQAASDWRRRGIPLELVARTMEDLYARHRERDSRRRIHSLRYFAPAVEAAWEELRALTGPGHREAPRPFDAAARLRRLADALPPGLHDREGWAARIAHLTGDSAAVEERLTELDRELLAASEAELTADERAAIDAARDRTLERLAGRLPAAELAFAAARLWRQQLRERRGLPVLSLFSPEASPPEPLSAAEPPPSE